MRRSARLSAISGIEVRPTAQEPEDQLRDVTAILNAEAGNTGRTSTSKRKRKSTKPAHNGESPSKKRSVEVLPESTPANPPSGRSSIQSSSRLKARPSLALRPAPSKRNAYDLPDSPTNKSESRNLMVPPVRMRVLNKRKQLPVSPFRGRGELDTRSTATVYLDDSPRKVVTKNRLQKIGSSFLTLKPTARHQSSADVPFNGDVFADALVASDGPDTPILLPSQANNTASTEAEINTPVKRRIPQASGGQVKGGARNASAASAEHDSEQMARPARVPNPLTHAVAATQNQRNNPKRGTRRSMLPEKPATTSLVPRGPTVEVRSVEHELDAPASGAGRASSTSGQVVAQGGNEDDNNDNNKTVSGQEDHDDGENEDENDDSPGKVDNFRLEADESDHQEEYPETYDVQEHRQKPRLRRPETEAERRRRQQAEAEQEDSETRRIRKAMTGIDEAAEMFGCKSGWQAALVASAEIIEERTYAELRSTNGKAVARSLISLVEAYRELCRHGASSGVDCSTTTIQQDLQVYKQRCQHISGCRHAPIIDHHQDRRRERKHMIWDIYEHLVPDSLKLAKYVLRLQYQNSHLSTDALKEVIEVLKITKLLANSAAEWKPMPKVPNSIKRKTQLKIVQNVEHIIRQYQDQVTIEDREIYRNELEMKQRADREQLMTELQQRRAAVREKHRPCAARISRKPVDRVVDIDALNVDGPVSQHTHPRREIPPATAKQWHSTELELLLNALQKYTSQTRFEDIVAVYGGHRGKLGKYNLDQIIAQARWFKQSMLRELHDLSDGQWDWLLSVPD
ncbi:hypothetical protein RBB50_005670 [Rhinocladiella similis]